MDKTLLTFMTDSDLIERNDNATPDFRGFTRPPLCGQRRRLRVHDTFGQHLLQWLCRRQRHQLFDHQPKRRATRLTAPVQLQRHLGARVQPWPNRPRDPVMQQPATPRELHGYRALRRQRQFRCDLLPIRTDGPDLYQPTGAWVLFVTQTAERLLGNATSGVRS